MIDYIPWIGIVVELAVMFYMFRVFLAHLHDEFEVSTRTYIDNFARTEEQMSLAHNTMREKADEIIDELIGAALQYRQTTVSMAKNISELAKSVCAVEKTIDRQKELEDEIIRLKSILVRKERQNAAK
jgi:hypothetical protein